MANLNIAIQIAAQDNASGPIGSIKGALGGLREGALGGFAGLQNIATLAGGALVGAAGLATAALVGTGAAGVGAFVDFDSQMREVFTLMPGISQQAMDDMSGQVLDFANDFGVLPDEVVPSLYQSLSAGIPPDNVFSFLETAQMAAAAGVTDLETAVDGISSVVNAYGDDVLGAADASDIMFTAVRLGKTDFQQLSSSLFNVIPTAASAGVQFGDIASQLATLTAQGTPTSVATTQIRAALVEATKSGTKLSDAINDLTGSSFTDLIAQGQTMPEIFQALRESMPEQDFRDLFGSVEAMNAALGITGPNFETVTGAMDEMQDSAGATAGAYDTMTGGLQFGIDKLKAFGQTALIQIGDALSPLIGMVLDFAEGALPVISDVLENTIIPAIETVVEAIQDFFGNLDEGMSPLDAFIEAIDGLVPPEVIDFLVQLRDEILPGLITFFQENIQPIIDWVTNFVSIKDVLMAIGLVIGTVVIGAIGPLVVAIGQVVAVGALLVGAIALVRNAWENDWGGIRTFLVNAWENSIKPALLQLWQWLQVNVPIALQTLRDFWVNVLLPAIQNVWSWISGTLIPFFTGTVVPMLDTILTTALTTLGNFWTNTLLPAITNVWQWISGTLMPFLSGTLVPMIETTITTALTTLADFWENTLLPAITAVWDFVQTSLVPLFEAVVELVEVTMTLALTALQGAWENILLPAITTVWDFIKTNLVPIIEDLIDILGPPIQEVLGAVKLLWDGLKGSLDAIKGVIQDVIGFIQGLIDKLNEVELPEWLVSNSPTPLEMGLRGINNALQETNRLLPQTQLLFAGFGEPPPGFSLAATIGTAGAEVGRGSLLLSSREGGQVATAQRYLVAPGGRLELHLHGVQDAAGLLEELSGLG